MPHQELPIPPHFDPDTVGRIWRVPYQERAGQAEKWAADHRIAPAYRDTFRLSLMLVDVQNTFCMPGFELYVGGHSGTAAVDDNRRICRFIYRNLHRITEICPTMDTHRTLQVFHALFLVNDQGEHPDPFSEIRPEDIEHGTWKFNPHIAESLGISVEYGNRYIRHYARELGAEHRYPYTIWPYHAMLGGIGHALVSAVEEAVFFHGVARYTQAHIQVKGDNPFTENYSVLSPEVLSDPNGRSVARRNEAFINKLLDFDAVLVAGQAKSHCLFWTVEDLLHEVHSRDRKLARKLYLLEDCTSPIVIPGGPDYTEQAEQAFRRFAEAGMHIVRTSEPLDTWPGLSAHETT